MFLEEGIALIQGVLLGHRHVIVHVLLMLRQVVILLMTEIRLLDGPEPISLVLSTTIALNGLLLTLIHLVCVG